MKALIYTTTATALVAIFLLGNKNSFGQQTQHRDPSQISPGPIRHKSLTANQVERAEKIRIQLQDVMPTPRSEWLDGFQRDQDPDQELKIWEAMTHAYLVFCGAKHLSLPAKQDALQVVLLRSDMSEGRVLKQLHLKVLSLDEAKQIMKQYKDPPMPITVTKHP